MAALVDAILALGAQLDLAVVLRRIAEAGVALTGARYAALGVLDEQREGLVEFVTVGLDDEARNRIGPPPKGLGLLGALITDARPLRVPDIREYAGRSGFPEGHPPMTSFLGVPIRVGGEVFGNLYLTDKQGEEVFTDIDEELMVGLASAAGVAIANARLFDQVRLNETALSDLVEEQGRRVDELHDAVVQELFVIGLNLRDLLARAMDETVRTGIVGATEVLEGVIRQIRTAAWNLDVLAAQPRPGLRMQLLAVTRELSGPLGFEPRVTFDGPIDRLIDGEVGAHAMVSVREALLDVAGEAQVTQVDITVTVAEGLLTISVTANGLGGSDGQSRDGKGVASMRARAEQLGGRFTVTSIARNRGTILEWIVPVP